MGVAKGVWCCRRMGRAGASNRWWDSRCGCGHSARRCRCARRRTRTSRSCWPVSARRWCRSASRCARWCTGRRRRRRRTCPGARPNWSPHSSTRSPRWPRDVTRWWRPASCRPECGYDRACGGDRRRRSDGVMLAAELALAGVDVAIVERRASQDLIGSRAGGLHARTIEVLDQRGIADRFLSQGQVAQIAGFAWIPLDISDFPTRHNYGLALWQNQIERILAGWVDELGVPIYRGREVTGFAQDDTGVDVALADGQSLRAAYLVGCDGGRSLIRKAAGIAFPGWDPSTSHLIAHVEVGQEPEWGMRHDE